MIIEAIILGLSIIFGSWLMSKTLVHIAEVFLKYFAYFAKMDQEAERKRRNG